MSRILTFAFALSMAWGLAPVTADLQGAATASGKPLADAVIWLDAPNAPRPAKQIGVRLDQRNMNFYPHVLVVRVGTVVQFPNSDRVFHDVFSFHDGKTFDLGLYPVGAVKNVRFDQPGLSRIFCNIHPHMAAYVMVVDTPYFAVSDDMGRFTIADVPVNTYAYHAWRPGGAILTSSVGVGVGGKALEVIWP